MNILITGATGRVGRKLAEALIARGDHVRTLALPDDLNLDQARQAGIDCIVGNLTDFSTVRQAVAEVEGSEGTRRRSAHRQGQREEPRVVHDI